MKKAWTFSKKDVALNLYLRLLIGILFLLIMSVSTISVHGKEKELADTIVKQQPKSVEVILQRHYLDGEVSEEIVKETIWSMEDFWAFYEGWQLVNQNEAEVVFRKELNDISPLLKINGYFGLAEDGTLNIYNGKPEHNDVIQSFFQVNTSRLKSHLHQNILDGIPVSSKDHYLQVLKMFEKYAINEL